MESLSTLKTEQKQLREGHKLLKGGSKYDDVPAEELLALPVEVVIALLRNASKSGNVVTVKEIEPDNSIIDTADSAGRSPLHLACAAGHSGVAAALMGRGANVDAIDKEGCTPLHLACMGDHALTVRMLLKHGANTTIADTDGLRPADVAGPSAMSALPADSDSRT